MKKFLLLSFLMVAFTSAVSFAQTRTISYYNSGGVQRLFFTHPPISSNTSMPDEDIEIGVTTDTTGLDPGVSVILMGINTFIDYVDNTTETFSNNDDLTKFSNIVSYRHSKGIYTVTYSFDLHFSDGHSESYYIMDSY